MEFWGVEVKPGRPLKVKPELGYIVHVSQASLGQTKKENESVPLYVKVGDQKLGIGTLASKCPQLPLDLFFEREFELSHNWKNGSVFFLGYQSVELMDGEEEGGLYSDFDSSEDEEIPMALTENGKPKADELKPKKEQKAKVGETKEGDKDELKPKKEQKVKVEETKEDDEEDESGSEEGDESDDDDDHEDEDELSVPPDSEGTDEDELSVPSDSEGTDEMGMIEDDSDDFDDSDEEEDEETPKKVEPPSKKRPNGAAVKAPVSKKAKTEIPQKSDGKKGGRTATPHQAKAGNKMVQSPKSGGQFSCSSRKKSFKSEVALHSHKKAKHGAK